MLDKIESSLGDLLCEERDIEIVSGPLYDGDTTTADGKTAQEVMSFTGDKTLFNPDKKLIPATEEGAEDTFEDVAPLVLVAENKKRNILGVVRLNNVTGDVLFRVQSAIGYNESTTLGEQNLEVVVPLTAVVLDEAREVEDLIEKALRTSVISSPELVGAMKAARWKPDQDHTSANRAAFILEV